MVTTRCTQNLPLSNKSIVKLQQHHKKIILQETFQYDMYHGKKQPYIKPSRGSLCIYQCKKCRQLFFIKNEMKTCQHYIHREKI